MRAELYKKIERALGDMPGAPIKYVNLWNRNVEFIEQEEAWPRPAVFVEFMPLQWRQIVPGVEYRAEATVNLHVVADWHGGAEADMEQFRLLDEIHKALAGIDGETFKELDLEASVTNHDHEEIVENIETYTCVAFRHLK